MSAGVGTRPATGAPGWARGVMLVVEYFWTWYVRNWRATVVSAVLQPVLFLLAFGIGFGSLIAGRPDAAAATGGVPYLQWLAPALLVVTAVQSGTFESSYPVVSGFKWQRTYFAMTAGPIAASQVVVAHVVWIGSKIAAAGVVFVGVVALVGGARGPGILGSLLAAVLAGAAVAACTAAYAATVSTDNGFNVLFRLVLIPMSLFSGTFFPVDRLPEWIRPLVWLSPLWHGTELARASALGTWQLWPALAHLAFLLAMLGIGCTAATRLFGRRLAP